MKSTGFVLTSLIVSLLIFSFFSLSSSVALTGQTVGVKEGDWMEYDVSLVGPGSMPPSHDVRWMRMEVLTVNGATFSVNVTVRYANGTMGSAIWQYNFVEGNTEGWTIIPANLGAGDTFFDSYLPGDIRIEREEQKTVLGASRTIIGGSDELREIKEWDKTTGFFTYSVEVYKDSTHPEGYYVGDLRVIIHAVDTNMWDRQILGLEKNVFVIATLALVIILAISALAFIWQRKNKTPNGT